jgi:DNA (cytosine-5)-methyltransferase 1
MRHGSLFSGIGGFDLAAEWMGWENVFHCEWMEFPRKVLDYHFPNADSHIDICKTDFTKYANTIDILTGGFPCQPFSLAGKRKGTDDERYLWGEMLRAIQEIKPRFVIAENVFGITNIDGGLVFQQVCLDLEGEGYEVQPFIIPACAKNAPHRRDRCWFIATNTNCNDGRSTDRKGGCEESKANGEGQQSIHSRIGATSNEGYAPNTKCEGLEGHNREREGCTEHRSDKRLFIGTETEFNAANSNSDGFNKCNGNNEVNTSQGGFNALNDLDTITMHTNCTMREGQHIGQKREGKFNGSNSGNGIDNFQNFPTQSPICGGDDGLPTELDGITFSKWRAESIKGYGNAIVPQIAYQLFQIINDL